MSRGGSIRGWTRRSPAGLRCGSGCCGCRRGVFLLLLLLLSVRRLVAGRSLSGRFELVRIVGHVPAGAFEHDRRRGNQFAEGPTTASTTRKGKILEALLYLKPMLAPFAEIFVDRHRYPLSSLVSSHARELTQLKPQRNYTIRITSSSAKSRFPSTAVQNNQKEPRSIV